MFQSVIENGYFVQSFQKVEPGRIVRFTLRPASRICAAPSSQPAECRMKCAPHWTAASMDIVLSCIACPSGSFDEVKAPEQRSGNLSLRASCPTTSEPSDGSGVPKVGAP